MNTRTSLKVVLISMPDIVPTLPIPIDEGSVYMPNLGIAGVRGLNLCSRKERHHRQVGRFSRDLRALVLPLQQFEYYSTNISLTSRKTSR